MILNIILLIIGMVLLIKGADFFVSGASKVAKALKIPSLIIGLTLVSIGTSAPELSVSITASLQGKIYEASADRRGAGRGCRCAPCILM